MEERDITPKGENFFVCSSRREGKFWKLFKDFPCEKSKKFFMWKLNIWFPLLFSFDLKVFHKSNQNRCLAGEKKTIIIISIILNGRHEDFCGGNMV
jgi:hypothetical protein